MKELFREPDITRVAFYQTVLEQEGIPTMIRNQHLTGAGLTEIPIPEFYPALCVLNDGDYLRAVQLIRSHLASNSSASDEEVPCANCGEPNPANFDLCWSCGQSVKST